VGGCVWSNAPKTTREYIPPLSSRPTFSTPVVLGRSDIPNVYADADLLVHLSHREGSPLVVIEALEFGVPCVAWDIPGSSEDVEDGVTGRAVPFGDHFAAADAIEQIFEQPGLLAKFGEGAQERFTRFAVGDYAPHIMSAIEDRRRVLARS